MELKEKVAQALTQVIDPETSLDVMRMRLVTDLNVTDDGVVSLTFIPSSPVCPLGFQLAISIQEAIKRVEGVKDIKIDVKNFVYAEQVKMALEQNK
ncbi:hypothetical protein B6D60_02180 [candidate division KSB1 bacterium 4484_87]|nr:MAG: hypothetical protein B6D60_02180 [candidate division KSB1 bacterium 4484_87]